MKRHHIACGLLAVSVIVLVAMMAGSLASYAPSVTRDSLQNIYIRNILWHAGTSAAMQIAAVVILVTGRSPRTKGFDVIATKKG